MRLPNSHASPSNSKFGFWASLDLLLVFLILLTLLLPALDSSIFSIHRQSEWAASQQRLSAALQYAHELYAYGAAPKSSKLVGLASIQTFVHSDYLDSGELASAQSQLQNKATRAGLTLEFQPPTPSRPSAGNQVCVRRMMLQSNLVGPTPSAVAPTLIWVCLR